MSIDVCMYVSIVCLYCMCECVFVLFISMPWEDEAHCYGVAGVDCRVSRVSLYHFILIALGR